MYSLKHPNRRKLKSSRNSSRMHYQMNVSIPRGGTAAAGHIWRNSDSNRKAEATETLGGALERESALLIYLSRTGLNAPLSPEQNACRLRMYSCCCLTHTRARAYCLARVYTAGERKRVCGLNEATSSPAFLHQCRRVCKWLACLNGSLRQTLSTWERIATRWIFFASIAWWMAFMELRNTLCMGKA